MAKHCVAIVAQIGAGKGLFTKIARRHFPHLRIVSIRFSDPLREITVKVLGLEETRENLQNIGEALRAAFKDESILSRALEKRYRETDADLVTLDGLRKIGEVAIIKKLGGDLLYIFADEKIRYRRRKNDPDNAGERTMTLKEFREREAHTAEKSIRHVGETMADIKIENNGTVEEFETKVLAYLRKRFS